MKKAMQLFSQLFGFEKLSKYEREHLHEANMQSSAYMGFIGVMLEIWMLRCLLIYRPYITILLLSASTVGFYQVLLTFQNGVTFKPKEIVLFGSTRLVSSGDMVNYIMFVISLTTMCIAMYHARLKEARKTYGLHMATVELERKYKEAHEQFVQTTDALASAIDAKDRYTNGHSRRVAEYSVRIAKAVGKSEEECERIYFTALLHDVGKIGVSHKFP